MIVINDERNENSTWGVKMMRFVKREQDKFVGGKEHLKENGCEMRTYKGNFARIKWGDKWKGKA